MILISESKVSKEMKKTTALSVLWLFVISFVNIMIIMNKSFKNDGTFIFSLLAFMSFTAFIFIFFEKIFVIINNSIKIINKNCIKDNEKKLFTLFSDEIFVKKYTDNYIFKDYRVINHYYQKYTKFGVAYSTLYITFFLSTLILDNNYYILYGWSLLNITYILALVFAIDSLDIPLLKIKSRTTQLFENYGYVDKESYFKLVKLYELISEIQKSIKKEDKKILNEFKYKYLLDDIIFKTNDMIFINKDMQQIITYEIALLTEYITALEKDKNTIIKLLKSETTNPDVINAVTKIFEIYYKLSDNLFNKLVVELKKMKDGEAFIIIESGENASSLKNKFEEISTHYK